MSEAAERKRLLEKLKKKPVIQYVGRKWVSRWEARRKPYYLKQEELEGLDDVAVKGKRHGTLGIFYPLEEIRMRSRDINWIPESYVSESRITKQMKPSEYDLAELRAEAVQGKMKGKRGTSTNYYSQESLFNILGVSVIPEKWIEKKDYELVIRYPDATDLAERRYALHKSGGFRAAGLFFWGRQATRLAMNGSNGQRSTRSEVIQEISESSEETESEEEEDEDPKLKALELEAEDLRMKLRKKEEQIRLYIQKKSAIYTSSSEFSE